MSELEQMAYANLVYAIIGAAHDVHKELHHGLSEAIYEECLCMELKELGLRAENQVDLPVYYKGQLLEKRYRLDIVVEEDVIIELKAVEEVISEHRAQLFNYLRIMQKPIGLLINFGKSVYVEKYCYDAETNDVTFFRYKLPDNMDARQLIAEIRKGQ